MDINGLDNITNIKEINEGGFRTIIISQEGGREAIIKIDNLGRIIKYENKYLKECGDRFLLWNNSIQELNLPQLERCGDLFLYDNPVLPSTGVEGHYYYIPTSEEIELCSDRRSGDTARAQQSGRTGSGSCAGNSC